MIKIFAINILKLVNKLLPIKVFKKQINQVYLNLARQTIDKLQTFNKDNISAKKIKTTLLFSGIKFNLEDDEFYFKLYNLLTISENLESDRNFLINKFKSKSFNSVGFRSWLRLRDLLYLKSEIVLGGICRKKAIDFAIKNKTGIFLSRKDKAKARIEGALNFDEVKNHFAQFPLEYEFEKEIVNKFIRSINSSKLNNGSYFKDNENNDFVKLLQNKTVAIVGPSETDNEDAIEIDSYDIVVRLNYTETGKNLDNIKKGLRADISYFNGEQIDYLIKNNDGKLPYDLKVACIKDNGNLRKAKLKKANPEKIIKVITNYNLLTFYSTFNILPLAVFDILSTDVKKIKIFHSDLFLTRKRSAGYFPSTFKREKNMSKNIQKDSFLNHDPMMHHEFLKKIYINDKILGDEKFDKVMKLETYDYLKELEDVFR